MHLLPTCLLLVAIGATLGRVRAPPGDGAVFTEGGRAGGATGRVRGAAGRQAAAGAGRPQEGAAGAAGAPGGGGEHGGGGGTYSDQST